MRNIDYDNKPCPVTSTTRYLALGNGMDLNGYQAMALCESLNATLTSIHSQAEMDWIIGLTLPLPDNKPFYAYWIGLYDRNMSYNWQWLDGTPVNYFHWNPNEPDDYRHLDFSIDFELSGFFPPGGVTAKEWSSEGLWVDYYPGYGLTGAICIKDSNIRMNLSGTKLYAPEVWVESDIGCGDGWVGLSQTFKCYRVVTQSMDYFEATKECEKLDATLVAIHSDNENAFLLKVTMNHTAFNSNLTDNFYWIGFNDHYNTIQWTWLDGTPANYFHWGELEPQYQGVLMSLACAVLIVDTKDRDYFTRRWKWMVSFCDTKQQGAICQKRIKIDPSTSANSISTISTTSWASTITGSTESSLTTTTTTQPTTTTAPIDCPVNESNPCDCGWTYYEPANKCFYATIQAMNYTDALNFCNNSDSVLASIHTRDEHNFLFRIFLPVYAFWIGLVDHNNKGNWNWVDGTKFDFAYWSIFEPNWQGFRPMNITCVILVVNAINVVYAERLSKWADTYCESEFQGVFCQKEAMNKSNMPSPTQGPQINKTITISSDKRMSDHYSSSLNQIDCFEPPSNREAASMIVARDTKHYDLYRTMDPIERECFVYAVSSLGDLCRLCAFYDIMNKCDDCVNLNATTDRVGFNSSYIRVEKVGCNGCPELVNIQCPEQANNGTPGWPSIIDITRSNISNLTYTRADSGVTIRGIWFRENDCGHGIICSQVATQRSSLDQLSNWRPYVLHPDIINANYATDALRDIIYECTFFYGLHGELVNNQDIQNGIVPSFDVTKSLFDDNARELMETLMERALRYENFSSIGGECSALNYERFASIKQNVHEKWLKSIDSFDNFRMINMILVPAVNKFN
uniref:C-type lectin domain-containing protein n=1 Tax=Acrobeloides nanus TaxID=290746 RepID=A0A914ECJ5_9BILA